MAGLAGLLGGYGSDDDDEQQQGSASPPLLGGILTAPSGSISPAAAQPAATTAAAAAATGHAAQGADQQTQQQQQASQPPMRVMDGPSTNPEPPPEGLSPPTARELDSNLGSEVEEGALPAALYGLPAELRDPPPGEPEPALQAHITKCLGLMRSGRSVMGELRKDPRFQNPKFLQKSVEFYSLQQYGTCLSPEVWDPSSLSEEDMWPALQQQLEARKRRRGAEVKFQPGGQQLPPLAAGMAAAAAAAAVASQPGMPGGGAPKVLSIDPRAAAAHAQALASTLVAGAGKKSKWDK